MPLSIPRSLPCLLHPSPSTPPRCYMIPRLQTSQNNLTLLFILFISPKLTIGPTISAPDAPHPSVLTQIPLVTVELQLQYSLTHTNPISHPAVAEQRTGRGCSGSVSLHLKRAESKHTPRPSDSRAHAHVDVPLLLLQRRRNWQLESHAVEVQTPLAQDLSGAHWLPQEPQLLLEVRRSWQVPLHSATPLPVQMGVGVGMYVR
jgi:hypothetical protein